ncbi:MAG TPA: 16S rRNA (cytidine(1402)-2'-O)-methyltransferase [Hydrogenothermaceae bacterium]|nr:16S rRNA (cytidine(1402)-2'-O)-methyltransferase [Hydrogenothermaceae bacterium]
MGKLFIVSTPIGNLEDITIRALNILKTVDIIACEDTRQTKKLLKHYGIEGKKLIPYYDFKEEILSEKLLNFLEENDVALVSDAGTPTISDPGYKIVKKAIEKGINVVPIPGVSAVITAISASGLPTDKFIFYGFLPKSEKQKEDVLNELKNLQITGIFYESPKRLLKTLEKIQKILPKSQVVVAKELTKLYEEFIRGNPKEILEFFEKNPKKQKGEFVILVYPEDNNKNLNEQEIYNFIKEKKQEGKKSKDIAKELAEKFNISKNKAYKMVINFT